MIERLLHFFWRYPLDLLTHLSSGFPIVVGFLRLKKLRRNEQLIWLLFIFYFLKDTYALIYLLLVPNNQYVQNIEQVITTLLVGLIYYYSFDQTFPRKIISGLTIVCTIITIYAYDSLLISSISVSAFRLFSIALSLLYFNKLMTDMQVKIITRHSLFWFTAALLIYTAGTFFIMLFSEYWNRDMKKVPAEVFDLYLNISQVLFIVFSLLSAYGLWVSKYNDENFL